jgi:hypothetical protein
MPRWFLFAALLGAGSITTCHESGRWRDDHDWGGADLRHESGCRRGYDVPVRSCGINGDDDRRAREIARALAGLKNRIERRYGRAFPNDPPPQMYWQQGPEAQLERLMEQALKDGRALTAEDLLRAQGMKPSPPDYPSP